MNLWQAVAGLFQADREHQVYTWIDPSHVADSPRPVTVAAGRHYVRLWLAEMFLARQTNWFTTWYPAVHSLTRFGMADKLVEIPFIADSTEVGIPQGAQGDVIARNFPLTPAIPFNGGVMEVAAGLMAVPGANYLQMAVGLLRDFSGLLNVPQFSTALSIASPVASGIQSLLGASAENMHLSAHDAFSAGGIRSGYVAVVRATARQVAPDKLYVVKDELHVGAGLGTGQYQPLVGYDYMLLRAEVFEERDDLEQLTSIQEPYGQALQALLDPTATEQASQYLRRALYQAMVAPELTIADRRRVVEALKQQFAQAKNDLGVSALRRGAPPTLSEAVARHAPSVEEALDLGPPTLAEVAGAGQ